MSIRNFISSFILMFLCVLPVVAYAQTATSTTLGFSQQGIFDCNRTGGASVGSTVAIGGPYVPVADYAVELNTGVLVYKECVLRNIVVRQREAALAAITKKGVTAIQTGRDGNARYVVNEGLELLENASDPEFRLFLQDGTLQNLNQELQAPVTRALALNYDTETRAPESVLRCAYQGDLNAALTSPTQSFSWEGLAALSNPACNPLGAYYLAKNLADNRIAQCKQYLRNQWDWGRGYYAITTDPNNPCRGEIVTPAVTVQESFQNVLDSSVRQLENANDIGQMISALFAGLETQIIGGSGGLAGISKSTGGQLSYIDQLVLNSSRGLRNATVNVALQILATARQVEVAYLQVANAIVATLTQASAQLRSAENQCWNLIIPKVCGSALNAQNECTDGGTTYRVATSTAGYAQSVITAQITPLVAIAATTTAVSRAALALIDELIRDVSNTSSPEAQRIALLRLDALVAQRKIHTQTDIDGPSGIVRQLNSVQAAMNTLVTDTVKSWADDPNPTIGWCNVNNPAVIQAWKDAWRK